MGCRSRPQIPYLGEIFPSQVEAVFYAWLVEMEKLGLVSGVMVQQTYEIFPGFKTETKTLFRPWTYTSDFEFLGPPDLYGLTGFPLASNVTRYVADTKGDHIPPASAASFSHKQKAMWFVKGVYVNRVQPLKFYPKNGFPSGKLPKECYMTDGKTLRQPWRRLKETSPSIARVYAQQDLGL